MQTQYNKWDCFQVEMDMLNVCLQSKGYDKRKGSASSKPIDFVNDCFGPFKEATHLNLIKAAHQVLCTQKSVN